MVKPYLTRYLARALSHPLRAKVYQKWWQVKSLLSPQLKKAEVFLKADDPYSYLLIQVLPELNRRFNIEWAVYIVNSLQAEMFPEPELWHANACTDAIQLANLYELSVPKQQNLSPDSVNFATAALLNVQQDEHVLEKMKQIFEDLWQGKQNQIATISEAHQQRLANNELTLAKRGHYLPATIGYFGEWFWGLDRLDHFERKLIAIGNDKGDNKVTFNRTYANFCRPFDCSEVIAKNKSEPVTLYYSIRSPYSHLALHRCIKLTQHYNIPLVVKPIIPMIMRGLAVPSTKKFYIFFDTKREADKHNIEYGFVADPLGDGVRRCYALYEYAQQQGRAIEFLLSYSNAVNAEGILSETNSGLRIIVERAGLDWTTALDILNKSQWQTNWPYWAHANEAELKQANLWGVPSIKYGEQTVWGQDRLEFIEQSIRDRLLYKQSTL